MSEPFFEIYYAKLRTYYLARSIIILGAGIVGIDPLL